MQRYPDADVLSSSDHLAPTADDDGLEHMNKAYSPMNIGIMMFRKSARMLAEEWDRMLIKDHQYWDQNAFNDLVRRSRGQAGENRLVTASQYKLKVGVLPVAQFCSGHTYFVQRLPEVLKREAYVVHATFQYSGTEGKRHRMREWMHWFDPPEYYDPPGGLLVYRPNLDEALVKGGPDDKGHFRLVNHQLVQVREALALAQISGRTLVMPQLWCGYDRWWAPHKGNLPGSTLKLPYRCPMDHVFEVHIWESKPDEHHFGPPTPFRESSFLENPRTPRGVKEGRVLVDVAGTSKSPAGGGDAKYPRVSVGFGTKEAGWREALGKHAGVKVVELTSLEPGTFGGFDDEATTTKFHNRLKLYAGIWCCHHAHPGHVWYDMLWDVIPHTDRHNRHWSGPWEPKTGP